MCPPPAPPFSLEPSEVRFYLPLLASVTSQRLDPVAFAEICHLCGPGQRRPTSSKLSFPCFPLGITLCLPFCVSDHFSAVFIVFFLFLCPFKSWCLKGLALVASLACVVPVGDLTESASPSKLCPEEHSVHPTASSRQADRQTPPCVSSHPSPTVKFSHEEWCHHSNMKPHTQPVSSLA